MDFLIEIYDNGTRVFIDRELAGDFCEENGDPVFAMQEAQAFIKGVAWATGENYFGLDVDIENNTT